MWCFAIFVSGLALHEASITFWTLKMTGWTYLMSMLYFGMSAYYTYVDEDCPPDANSYGRKVTFLLYEAAFSWSPTVVVLFWAFLYSSDYTPKTTAHMLIAVHTHGIGFVLLLLDLVWNKLEFLPSHLILIVPLGLLMT